MRRIQCLICYGFMNATKERICSDQCREERDRRNRDAAERISTERKNQAIKRKEFEKKRALKSSSQSVRKKRKRAARNIALHKKIKEQAKIIRALKQRKPVDGFYDSIEWRDLRYRVLKKFGRKCMLCRSESGEMHVDHIKPRSKFPELALDFNNLQVLCRDCNLGKSNRDQTDFRSNQ